MEILQNPVLVMLLWLATTFVTEVAKRYDTRAKVIAVLISIVLWIWYYLFEYFTEPGAQEFVINSAMKILWYATVAYHIYKQFTKKNNK